jgi:hypothetical protein
VGARKRRGKTKAATKEGENRQLEPEGNLSGHLQKSLRGASKERLGKCRGARPGPGGEISDAANEAVVERRDARGNRLELPAGSWGQARRGEGWRGRRKEEREARRVEVEICSGVQVGAHLDT